MHDAYPFQGHYAFRSALGSGVHVDGPPGQMDQQLEISAVFLHVASNASVQQLSVSIFGHKKLVNFPIDIIYVFFRFVNQSRGNRSRSALILMTNRSHHISPQICHIDALGWV